MSVFAEKERLCHELLVINKMDKLNMTRNISLTLSQFISNESAFCAVLSFRLGDHHGGKWRDEAVPQGHV